MQDLLDGVYLSRRVGKKSVEGLGADVVGSRRAKAGDQEHREVGDVKN